MKFGLLGYYPGYNHNDMEVIDFSSDKTILEYDVLIVGLNNIFVEYRHNSEYNGFPRITDHDSMQLKRDLERRKNEIKEFLESGKSIIIINGNDECVYCYTGNKTVSGTGRNAQTTYIVHDVHSSSLLPVKMSSMNLSGNAVPIVNKNISETFKKYSDYIEYKNCIWKCWW